jgi:hypothetical protein
VRAIKRSALEEISAFEAMVDTSAMMACLA